MEKHFATYEQSLALKELGFDMPCFKYVYIGDTGNNINRYEEVEPSRAKNYNKYFLCISQPLKSQVFEFFRGYRLTVVIEDYLDDYEVKIVEWTLSDDRITHEFPNRFDSWGDAESASIDKLIELVKKK